MFQAGVPRLALPSLLVPSPDACFGLQNEAALLVQVDAASCRVAALVRERGRALENVGVLLGVARRRIRRRHAQHAAQLGQKLSLLARSAAPEAAHFAMKASRFWPMPGSIVTERLTFGRGISHSTKRCPLALIQRVDSGLLQDADECCARGGTKTETVFPDVAWM